MLNGSYQNTRPRVLVAALLPLRPVGAMQGVPRFRSPIQVEVFEHPFALSTVVHLELALVNPWPPAAEASELLRTVLAAPLVGDASVRDGLPIDQLRSLPGVDNLGRAINAEDAGRFVILSALHAGPSPTAL